MQNNQQYLLTIGQLAKRSDIAISAIRFYEEKGLLFSVRTNGNQRRYAKHMLRRIAVIKVAQKVGLSLEDIKQAFELLPTHAAPSKSDWQSMSQRWQQALNSRIELLRHMQTQLDWCIGCGCLSLEHCPLRNPNDVFALNPQAHPYWE